TTTSTWSPSTRYSTTRPCTRDLPCPSACSAPFRRPFSFFSGSGAPRDPHSFPTRRSSDLPLPTRESHVPVARVPHSRRASPTPRSEEHTSELQSLAYLVCRLLLEKKKTDAIHGFMSAPLFMTLAHAQPAARHHDLQLRDPH